MSQIFDNIELKLLEGLHAALPDATASSFCVGYLNLRGWGQLADLVEGPPGGDETKASRLLVGMHRPPEDEIKALAGLKRRSETIDGPTLARLKRRITESFKEQIEFGVPSSQAETSLRRLASQLRACKVYLKAFLGYPLHAKLYLVRRSDAVTPLIGFVGSSNFTWFAMQEFASKQGGFYEFKPMYVARIPIPRATPEEQVLLERLVDKILSAKRADPNADVSSWERAIGERAYRLYGLTKNEIKIVEEI
jgi:hypothetical protein